MKILYLAEDYIYSKVHYNLCTHLWQQEQVEALMVFGIIRNVGMPRIDDNYAKVDFGVHLTELDGSPFLYRADFAYKLRRKMQMLQKHVDCTNIDVTFAATLFSEGAVAYKLYRKFCIPYVVAIRGTDINTYLRYMPHLWPLAIEILRHADHVVFINNIVRERLLNHWAIGRFVGNVCDKCSVLPNGIDNYWLEHRKVKRKTPKGTRLLYIGNFDRNKNVEALQKAVLHLRQTTLPKLSLALVGGGSTRHEAVMKNCNKHPEAFQYYGKIFEKNRLAGLMAECDAFAMVSHSETFGLVYIEALSQGLPVIYTKGEGIDGHFSQKIGVAVNSHNTTDIENGIKLLFNEYEHFEGIDSRLDDFCWPVIAKQYLSILQSAVAKRKEI